MPNQEILEKAIQKAIDNGWLPNNHSGEVFELDDLTKPQKQAVLNMLLESPYQYEYLFDKGFAKALWGEEESAEVITRWHRQSNTKDDWIGELVPEWKKHLQQMVIAEDPIQYLGENI